MSSGQLQIAVEKSRVRLLGTDGTRREAAFFLHRVGLLQTERRKVGDLLNEAEHCFLACETSHSTELWNLDEIAYVELVEDSSEVEELEKVGALRTPALVHLAGGEVLEGEFVYEAEASRTRLSDLLNNPQHRFLLLQTPEATIYVNRRAILRVQL